MKVQNAEFDKALALMVAGYQPARGRAGIGLAEMARFYGISLESVGLWYRKGGLPPGRIRALCEKFPELDAMALLQPQARAKWVDFRN